VGDWLTGQVAQAPSPGSFLQQAHINIIAKCQVPTSVYVPCHPTFHFPPDLPAAPACDDT